MKAPQISQKAPVFCSKAPQIWPPKQFLMHFYALKFFNLKLSWKLLIYVIFGTFFLFTYFMSNKRALNSVTWSTSALIGLIGSTWSRIQWNIIFFFTKPLVTSAQSRVRPFRKELAGGLCRSGQSGAAQFQETLGVARCQWGLSLTSHSTGNHQNLSCFPGRLRTETLIFPKKDLLNFSAQ